MTIHLKLLGQIAGHFKGIFPVSFFLLFLLVQTIFILMLLLQSCPSLILVLAQSVVEQSCVHLVTALEVHEFAGSVLVVGQAV